MTEETKEFKNVLFLQTETGTLQVLDTNSSLIITVLPVESELQELKVPQGYTQIESLFELSKAAFTEVDNYLTKSKVSATRIVPLVKKVTLELRETKKENNFKKK